MTQSTIQRWKQMQTDETRSLEQVLRKVFPATDAYRYNSASIRVRVIDTRFEGKTTEERDAMVEPLLDQLPPETQADIINLLTLSPNETAHSARKSLANLEFEDPSESML
jgi:hypothetical protein